MYLKRKEYQCDICKNYSIEVYVGKEIFEVYDKAAWVKFYNLAIVAEAFDKARVLTTQICTNCLKIKDMKKHLIGREVKFYEVGNKS